MELESRLEFSRTMTKNELIDHAPVEQGYPWVELLSLLLHFLHAGDGHTIKATVVGKRKRKIGLFVPGKYDCYTRGVY